MEYYYIDNHNQVKGPVSIDELRTLALSRTLNSSAMFIPVGSQQWLPLAALLPEATAAPNSTEPLAIWSLVLSLPGICCCALSIVAIVCGHLALSKIERNPHLQGKELAISGLVISYSSLALGLIWGFFIAYWSSLINL